MQRTDTLPIRGIGLEERCGFFLPGASYRLKSQPVRLKRFATAIGERLDALGELRWIAAVHRR